MEIKMSKILVIGDCIIDEYVFSTVERISPEAPVPIAKVVSREFSPGGAGNVACSLANLGDEVAFLSVFSLYDNSMLFDMLNSYGIYRIYGIQAINKNITKTRVISDGHHLLRIDEEYKLIYDNIEKQLNKFYDKIVKFDPDLIVISDYNKYMIEILSKFNNFPNFKCKIIADIKPNNFIKLKDIVKSNIYAILPNEKEIIQSTSYDNYKDAAKYWIDNIAENIIVTRGHNGISLFSKATPERYIPSAALEVNDVTGCGDTVTSVYAHLIAQIDSEIDAIDAIVLANKCAGITASKIGTYKINKEELDSVKESYFSRGLHSLQ